MCRCAGTWVFEHGVGVDERRLAGAGAGGREVGKEVVKIKVLIYPGGII